MRSLKTRTDLQFTAMAVVAWAMCAGAAWFGFGLLLGLPSVGVALFVVSGCAGAVACFLTLLVGFVVITGRGGMPADYQYDWALLDVLGSTTITVAMGLGAGALASSYSWTAGAVVGAVFFAIFAITTHRGFVRGRTLRQTLPPPTHFWPSDPLREHPPTGHLTEPLHVRVGGTDVWGWTQLTERGTVGIIYVGNPTLEFGSPAPKGRIDVVHGRLTPADLEAAAAGLDQG